MIGSYFKTAVRAIARDPFHAVINVIGLSVALAAALLIGAYVRHELSYEDFITEPGRVYRVEADYTLPGQSMERWASSPYPLPELLEADYGEQLTATRLRSVGTVFEVGGKRFRPTVSVVDESFLDVIDLPVMAGDANAALREPGSIILSRQVAVQMFGTEDAIGKTLQVNETTQTVAAILEDPRSNSQFRIEILASASNPAFAYAAHMSADWSNHVQQTFVRLHDGAQADAIETQMPAFVARHKPDTLPIMIDLNLRPLRQLHLAANPDARGKIGNRNAVALAALAATGAFLIFIACFSYMNLATARSLLRIKEVGLRKILGGRSHHLAFQFLAESTVITAVAFAIGVIAAAILMRPFAALVDRELRILDMADPVFMAIAMGLIVLVSLGAGAYPALVLASRKPIALFQGKRGAGSGGGLLRTGIVSIQFGMTAALMIAAVVVFAQVSYLRNIDLGFEERGLLMVPVPPFLMDGEEVFRERLAQSPYIEAVAGGGTTPRPGYDVYMPLSKPGSAPGTEQNVLNVAVGDHFFEVYGVAPLAGRVFSDDPTQDVMRPPAPDQLDGHGPLILSESAVSFFGLGEPADAIGKELIASEDRGGHTAYSIVGVVPDLHFRLGRQAMTPMVFTRSMLGSIMVREITAQVRPGASQAAIADAQRIWAAMFPGETMTYDFLEDRIAAANADDERQSGLFAFFAVLALFVACLGLFALSSFVVARRTYEVAVRKTIGASTGSVTRLLMWDFAKPVLLANVIGWPIAWLMVRAWLERFPVRIELSPVFFLGVSGVALLVAMLTIASRTLRSARAHPAMVLRSE